MKHMFVLGLILLAGCSSTPTMEELEAEAMQTGDWSKVEDREVVLARREGRAELECPTGYAVFCKSAADFGRENCRCVSRETHKAMFNESVNVQPPNPRQVE